MTNLRNVAAALCLGGILASGSAEAVQRVFVSSGGNDANTANNCSFTLPCRTFAGAIGIVDVGGEIVALDAAGYSVVTITKSISIIANPGFYAGVTAQAGNGITIATAGVNVILRGLNINGLGGSVGINMTDGASLTLDNCVISNFSSSGLIVNAPSAKVKVSNSVFSTNGQDGVLAAQGKVDVTGSRANGNTRGGFSAVTTGGGNTATLTVTDSSASGNAYGFFALANATTSTAHVSLTRVTGTNQTDGMRVEQITGSATGIVGNSTFTENVNGLNNVGGILRSLGNNVVDFNTNNATGVTALGGL